MQYKIGDGKSNLADDILDAISSVLGDGPVPLHEPIFAGNELEYLKDCLDTTYVSSVGPYVDLFESELARYTSSKYAVAVVNGTAALHISLLLAGVKPGDEVLVPSLSFVATANAVTYCSARPHFVDSEEQSLGIDAAKLSDYLKTQTEQDSGQCINRKTKKVIRSLVPMHTFGHPSDMEGLLRVAHDFNLTLVEDAAESLGSFYDGRHTGTFGILGALSFNGNKIATTGGGGAILTNNKNLALKAKHLTTTAKIPHLWKYDHDEIGYNFRLPNLNAALGCAQLEQLESKLKLKQKLFKLYEDAFKKINGALMYKKRHGCEVNYWLQTLLLEEASISLRDEIISKLNMKGYYSRPAWSLLDSLTPYSDMEKMDLTGAKLLSRKIINIPSNWCPNE